jgi:hypothetical protein
MLAALALTTLATIAEAGPFRRRVQSNYYYPAYQPVYQSPAYYPATTPSAGEHVVGYSPVSAGDATATTEITAVDGLDEVNAKRAARGLRPFIRDEGLTIAARGAAIFRARYGMFGHTSNDFAFLPAGHSAASAGCAAYPSSYGWMSCCTYENYTYAGAAWVTGADGRRFMHLYVR